MYDYDQTPKYFEVIVEETELDLILSLVQDFRKLARSGGFEGDEMLAVSIMDKLHATSQMPLKNTDRGLIASK